MQAPLVGVWIDSVPRYKDLLFQASEKKLKFVADYVDTIQSNLKSAFQLARSQQYAAAIGNRDRAHEKSRPNFKLGDKLYVWEVSSADIGPKL